MRTNGVPTSKSMAWILLMPNISIGTTRPIFRTTRFRYPEPRFWAFALWKHRLYLVAFCRRGAKVRIISFRKANRKEVKRYGE